MNFTTDINVPRTNKNIPKAKRNVSSNPNKANKPTTNNVESTKLTVVFNTELM